MNSSGATLMKPHSAGGWTISHLDQVRCSNDEWIKRHSTQYRATLPFSCWFISKTITRICFLSSSLAFLFWLVNECSFKGMLQPKWNILSSFITLQTRILLWNTKERIIFHGKLCLCACVCVLLMKILCRLTVTIDTEEIFLYSNSNKPPIM